MPFLSPLRYPGGKRKLANYIKLVFLENGLLDSDYVEVYAGGAGVALALLIDEYVRRIHINDLDKGIYSFWHSVLAETEGLCRLIHDTPVTMEVWERQKQVQEDADASPLELGFSTFFLNRTNRSGIISGGVIGGKNQTGKWKIDARFNKPNLLKRIRRIARFRERIHIYNLDAAVFMQTILPTLPGSRLSYLDPPYYVAGQQDLYTNYYGPEEHADLADLVTQLEDSWLVSYDNVAAINSLYSGCRAISYDLHYSAQSRYEGAEVMFFSADLSIPEVDDPVRLDRSFLQG